MKTVKLEEIVRQKEPELKQVVEQFARGEVGDAVQGLEWQGRVHETAGRERFAQLIGEAAPSYWVVRDIVLILPKDLLTLAQQRVTT